VNSWQKAAQTSDLKAPPAPPQTHPFHTHKAHVQVLNIMPLLERETVRKRLLYLQNERKQAEKLLA